MTSSAEIAREHMKASRRVMRKALRSKRIAKAFLIRTGILTKDGKQLAKPYR